VALQVSQRLADINPARSQSAKVSPASADLPLHMLSPISSSQASQVSETAKPVAFKPQAAPQQSTPQPTDKVTLKSTGDVDHDGDSK
jgi:hypothetical protein